MDYTAYFRLGATPIDGTALSALHKRLGIVLRACTKECVVDDSGEFSILPSYERIPAEYYREISRQEARLYAVFGGEGYSFTLGVAHGFGDRFALFELSERSLSRMGDCLQKSDWGVLAYLVDLYRATRAESMALGLDTWPDTLATFLRGELDQKEIEDDLRTAIAAPNVSESALAQAGASVVTVSGVRIVTRWLPGCESELEI